MKLQPDPLGYDLFDLAVIIAGSAITAALIAVIVGALTLGVVVVGGGEEPEPAESPRRGLYVAFQRIGSDWHWRCLRCGASGIGHSDELALSAAIAHPCAHEEVQA